jgi:hypothetical protein
MQCPLNHYAVYTHWVSGAVCRLARWPFGEILRRRHQHCHHIRHRPNHKRAQQWRRRTIPFGLIRRCHRRSHCRPARLDGSFFLSSCSRKHTRWKRGRLRAHVFFSSARLSKFGQGLRSIRQPYVGLLATTLDSFCNKKDFLHLFRLLSKFNNIDHVDNVTTIAGHVHTLCGTFGGTYESCCPDKHTPLDPKTLMLIWDTGTSYGLTPFRSNFVDYVKCDIAVKDVTKVNKVIGIGTTLHKFTDTNGLPVYLLCVSYHLPETDIRLFSPQTYHQIHGGYSEVYGDCIKRLLKTSTIEIKIVREQHNLPAVFDSFVPEKEKRALAGTMGKG